VLRYRYGKEELDFLAMVRFTSEETTVQYESRMMGQAQRK
jgi:hypothetical protein